MSEYIDKIIVTDDELIIKDLDGKTKINDAYKFVSKILYTNIQNIANNTELEYEKYIIEYDETEEEIKKRKIPKLHFQEVNNEDNMVCCCVGMDYKKRKYFELRALKKELNLKK